MKYRSSYEKRVHENVDGRRTVDYEPPDAALNYNRPATYIPDFRLANGILVEAKGYFKPADRTKMLLVKKQNPHADIRFLFQRASNRLTKSPNSMTYWQWAERHGFQWAEGERIPDKWFTEKNRKKRVKKSAATTRRKTVVKGAGAR